MLLARIIVTLIVVAFLGIFIGLNLNHRVDVTLLPKVDFQQVSVVVIILVGYLVGVLSLLPIVSQNYFKLRRKFKEKENLLKQAPALDESDADESVDE